MKVLVACEESQRVCSAFRDKGHEAFSCDLLPCSGGHPEWHIQGDVIPLLDGFCEFETQNGDYYFLCQKWDLIIAHPPCTRLCSSGQRWLYYGSPEYRANKLYERRLAVEFFLLFTLCDCDRVAIENPVGIMSSLYRKPDFFYNPYDFEGETECKKTGIWLIGDLKPLIPTRAFPLPKDQRTHGFFKAHFGNKKLSWNSPETARLRSQTPIGVARAMADQWG